MDEKLFEARVRDTFEICKRTEAPRFFGFLNEEEAATAEAVLKRAKARFCFWGGFEGSSRTVLCCFPNWCENPEFHISAISVSFRVCDRLSHRDFLGALMGLGIVREAIGDILIEDGRAVIFILDDIVDFVLSQLVKVGRIGVSVKKGFFEPLPSSGKKLQLSETVASLRLDCIVAAISGVSRSAAAEKISEGLISLNAIPVQKPTKIIKRGDIITVRGKGKFTIDSADEYSKKGRIILKYSKYI